MVPVRFPDGSVAWLPEHNLHAVPSDPLDLTDRFAAGHFAAPDWLRRTLTRIRLTGHLSNMIYSMEATETEFYAFQFKPVLKLLNSPTDALLIADEVGLGKTIEAGLIWTELRARFDSNRLLVVCPKTLCQKWQTELLRRFGVHAQIADASHLYTLLFNHGRRTLGFAAVASMQALRPPTGWDLDTDPDSPVPDSPRRALASALAEAANDGPLLDLLVIDEAHHMRNPRTLLYRSAQLLNAVAAHRVFLSATPIHLRNRDLHSLLYLVDPDTFEYESTLADMIVTNQPIVETRDLLLRPTAPLPTILSRLDAARQLPALVDSEALRLLHDDLLAARVPLDMARRAQFASRLEEINQLTNYVARTRRRDVKELRVVRDPKAPTLKMHDIERHFYDSVTSEVAKYAATHDLNASFLLSTILRMLTSSPAAASNYWCQFSHTANEEIEETDENSAVSNHPLLARLATLARALNLTVELQHVDTKFHLLLSQLRDHWETEPSAKIVLFSSFKPTLRYLFRRLQASGIHCALIHGSIAEPRHTILSRFRNDPSLSVLLASEVGGEGVDLQFCSTIVNYDLPWNPMRLEQRIGRVDRLGQEQSKVTVLNLIYRDTIDALIYFRLYERLGIAIRALGGFEPILGEPIREMTTRLLNPQLTPTQRAAVVDQTAAALEYRRRSEDELEETAGALIGHGDYVLQKIHESRQHHRWVAGDDVLDYIKNRLDRRFPGCRIESAPAGTDTYRILLTEEARAALCEFVIARGFRGATRLTESDRRQRYRFVSSVVQGHTPRIEHVSQLHPLVRFVVDLDATSPEIFEPLPVASWLSSSQVPFHCEAATYVVGVRRQEVRRTGRYSVNTTHIAYVGANVRNNVMLSPDEAEGLVAATAAHGRVRANFGQNDDAVAALRVLRQFVTPELDRLHEDFVRHARATIHDRCVLRERALKRHRERKAQGWVAQRDRLRTAAARALELGDSRRSKQLHGLAAATDGKLRKLDRKIDARLTQIREERDFVPEWSDVSSIVVEVRL